VITELGCSERLREVLGGTPDEADARFLALVDQGVERIHAERASARGDCRDRGGAGEMQRRG
jgi:hypothetical protein